MKPLFFGLEVSAPWPASLPQGRVLDEEARHLTLAFLGPADEVQMLKALQTFPPLPFKVGFVGQFDQCLFLPPKHPHVVAWHVQLFEANTPLHHFYTTLHKWLEKKGFHASKRHNFSPHVTLARSPFNERVWEKAFTPLPLMLTNLHLYQSLGHSKYTSLWHIPLTPPFEELSHTADVAYAVYGESFTELYQHAQMALAFFYPPFLSYVQKQEGMENLDDVIIALNALVSRVDLEIGCPLKAVSFHSHLEKTENLLKWEMILDV